MPSRGWLRRGAARLYTTWSTWPRSARMASMTWRLISSEKASPLMLRAYRPSAWANLWKAALLCQPGVPGGWLGRALEEHAQRLRAACEGRADARGQAVAGGRADHQHALGRAGDGTLLAHVVDLLAHIGLAAGGMGGHADETAHAGLDDQAHAVLGGRVIGRGLDHAGPQVWNPARGRRVGSENATGIVREPGPGRPVDGMPAAC